MPLPRRPVSVRPTQAQLILTHATVVQAQFERARADLAAFADGRIGRVSVAGFATAIAGSIAPAIKRLQTARPGIIADGGRNGTT